MFRVEVILTCVYYLHRLGTSEEMTWTSEEMTWK